MRLNLTCFYRQMKKSFVIVFCLILTGALLLLTGCGGSKPSTYSISGRIVDLEENGISGVSIVLTGGYTGTATTGEDGSWSAGGLKGTVTVTPVHDDWVFSPLSREVNKAAQDVDFTGNPVDETTTYTLTVQVEGNGTVTPAPGAHEYEEGTIVNLEATAGEGYEFSHWTGDVADTQNSVTTVTMDADKTVTAVFTEIPVPTYTLTIQVEGNGSVIPTAGTHDYDEGTVVNLSANPDFDFRFVKWVVGVEEYEDSSINIEINSNLTVTAVFRAKVTAVAGGIQHSMALLSDNTVMSWGSNNFGQLGDGTEDDSGTPVAVSSATGLNYVSILAAGWRHSLALSDPQTAWTWGYNYYGQLGDGTTVNRSEPVQISGLPAGTILAISGGMGHTVVLLADGTVWAWGDNQYGQLGDGTTDNSSEPVQVTVPAGKEIIAVSAGGYHNLAVAGDGTVWAWGQNSNGQLGTGSYDDSSVPVEIATLSEEGIIAVAGGGQHSLALSGTGEVWGWGQNWDGQAGGSGTTKSTPVIISGLNGVEAIDAGLDHSIALLSDNTVVTWGRNEYGQLGDGDAPGSSNTPVAVTGLANTTAVYAGQYHNLALTADGAVWAWGRNDGGQLGDGTTNNSSIPLPVEDL